MGSQSCMNEACRVTTSSEWKSGWQLKSGGFATLCVSCGVAYEKSTYCSTFHLEEDGWRECRFCKKHVHCGCSASKTLLEILDLGGVGCANCVRHMEAKANANATSLVPVQVLTGEVAKVAVPAVGNGVKRRNFGEMFLDADGSRKLLRMQKCGTSGAESSLGQNRGEGPVLPFGDKFSAGLPHFTEQPAAGSSVFARPESHRVEQRKELYEGPSLGRPSLNISLSSHLHGSGLVTPFSDALAEGSDQNRAFSPHRRPQLLPRPPKPVPGPSSSSEASRAGIGYQRVPRPPAEGRGRCQLLPRYWPRITEQELQQISGDLKAPIVPLFEKVLSASDAGRIGRLVLPKACAEAYFPPINQSEGLPINIQDVKGREWTFQFRFWPNNNSRMYVLEGVTPCIQNMNLQAGDTVTFSRRDPGGQLVMGFRRSTSNIDALIEPQAFVPATLGGSPVETSHSGASDGMICLESAKTGNQAAEDSLPSSQVSEKKKARNLGTKNKRLHMHDDDAVELRVTWEEAQELLRPPPMNSPTVVKIDDYEFEEYNEPPVFGKKTVFTVGPSGQQEQWTQCDSCKKWRKLPVHVLVPAKWTCPDNEWDTSRASCLAPDMINPQEQEALLIASRDYMRRTGGSTAAEDCEPSGLDALATAAVLGDNVGDLAESAATTRHPRHRVGCSCIVCIQPPSGKGKHPPYCKCTVCLTVKRRFKTLMQRKKKRQSDREAELAQQRLQNQGGPSIDLSEMEGAAEAAALVQMTQMGPGVRPPPLTVSGTGTDTAKGGLDLNCHPGREDDMLAEASAGISMDSLMDAASLPLDIYLRQSRLVAALVRPAVGDGGGSSSGPEKKAADEQ